MGKIKQLNPQAAAHYNRFLSAADKYYALRKKYRMALAIIWLLVTLLFMAVSLLIKQNGIMV